MRVDFPGIAVPRQCRQLLPRRVAEQRLQRPSWSPRQLPNGQHADLGQPRFGDRAHSPHQFDRQVMKDAVFLPEVYAKALLYRSPAVTNVYIQGYYGMYNYAVLGVSH